MSGVNNIVDTAIDVIVLTLNNKGKIQEFENYINYYKDVINVVYMGHPEKEPVLECLTETCLCLEHSMFAAISGFYSVAYDSLRKVIELAVFGIFFDKHNTRYTDWRLGVPEFGFTQRLRDIFNFPEIAQWVSFPSCSTFQGDILSEFKQLSSFTHSSPSTWTKEQRHTWKLIFSSVDFDKWHETALKVIKLSTTITLLYMSELIDEPFAKLVDNSIKMDILRTRL